MVLTEMMTVLVAVIKVGAERAEEVPGMVAVEGGGYRVQLMALALGHQYASQETDCHLHYRDKVKSSRGPCLHPPSLV